MIRLVVGSLGAALLAACSSTTTLTSTMTSETPSPSPSGQVAAASVPASCPTGLVAYPVAAPRGFVCAPPDPAPVPASATGCFLIYQGHNASIAFTGADAPGWCDQVSRSDGHWFAALGPADTGSLTVDLVCHGSTTAGGYWVVSDTGGDAYGKQGCALLNQLGLRSPQEN